METSLELRHVLKQLASEENRTIIVSSHNMDVIQDVCRRVIILSQGRIVADDHISDLVSLFKTKAYRIILLEPVPEGLEEALASRFKGATVTGDGRRTEVRVNLLENDDIYTLMDILRDRGAIIDEISNEETDLEKAFLEIVRRSGTIMNPVSILVAILQRDWAMMRRYSQHSLVIGFHIHNLSLYLLGHQRPLKLRCYWSS